MSSWGVTAREPEPAVRRVREVVKDGVAVIVTSALASTAMAVGVLFVTKLAG